MSRSKNNPENDDVWVIVSIADNGMVHAWSNPDGALYQSRREAVNAANRHKRHNKEMYPDHEIRISVCKLLEGL